jgi:hypothetical protein
MINTTDDLPPLPSPIIRALLTETYEQAEHRTATKYGIKISHLREENLAGNISTAVIFSTATFIFAAILFAAVN